MATKKTAQAVETKGRDILVRRTNLASKALLGVVKAIRRKDVTAAQADAVAEFLAGELERVSNTISAKKAGKTVVERQAFEL